MGNRSNGPELITKNLLSAAALFFILLVGLSLVGLSAWSAWNARAVQLRELETVTENMARSLAQQADDTFKIANTSLLGLSERLAHDGTSPESLARLHNLLFDRVTELPALQGISVFDKNGKLLVNARPRFDPKADYKDREFFKYHLSHADSMPHIGPPIHSLTNDQWIIPLSRRLNDASGQFAGIVVATIGLDYFHNFYASYDIGRDGVILLTLNDSILLIRWPEIAGTIGKPLIQGPLLGISESGANTGHRMITSPFDGIERLHSYTRLSHYPVVVTVALSKDEILFGWRQATLVQGLITAAIMSMLAWLGAVLYRQIALRVQAEEEAKRSGEELRKLNRVLEQLALQDGLTGLANRRQFDLMLQEEFRRAARSMSPLALIMIDIDFFKMYNDLYGHLAGDECLRQVGRVLKTAEHRPGDVAARYGGEEFAILLPSTDLAGAMKIAEDIGQTLQALRIRHDGTQTGMVTISAGVNALIPATPEDAVELLVETADMALYTAKSYGRDQVVAYDCLRNRKNGCRAEN